MASYVIYYTGKDGEQMPRTLTQPVGWAKLETATGEWTFWPELEYCETASDIDTLLSASHPEADEKMKYDYLYDYMKIKSVAHMGGIDEKYDLLYTFIRDVFLSGNWRPIS